jgi:hypothetical protein
MLLRCVPKVPRADLISVADRGIRPVDAMAGS